MKRRFDLYFNDVLKSIDRIKEYTSSLSFEEFTKDNIKVDAVMRNLEVIGEAVTQLPKEIKEKYKNVPWKDIQDFRIVVAHRYWKVNQERIWDIIKNKLDALEQQTKGILKKEINKK